MTGLSARQLQWWDSRRLFALIRKLHDEEFMMTPIDLPFGGQLSKDSTGLDFSVDEDELVQVEEGQTQLDEPAGNRRLQRSDFRWRVSLLPRSSLTCQLFKQHQRFLALLR